ncbi:MAG: FKBP-type peptidyl-prolyl cis-trans isomerase [Clostridia bacterium]|nr:FKBP-type peptidyl-prolyl cis-trans isomerase [Clostridia bacterium]
MKKIIALFLAMFLMLSLAGCGSIDRLNYVKGLDKYVTLCDIEAIKVDTNSADYITVYKDSMASDLNTYTYSVSEGKVADGDITNIDYAGKVDGVAFTGGTAKGFDLTIGSGQFIEGFEEQLIGVKIGSTVDIKVTFPANYGDSTDLETGSKTIKLSGADAIFTVTVNSVKRPFSDVNDEFAKAAGFDNANAYLADLDERCIKKYIYDYLINNTSVTKLPPDNEGNCYSYHKNYYTDYAKYNGISFEELLSYYGMDEATFKNNVLTEEVVLYAAFDKLGLEVTDEAINAKIEELAKLNETTAEEIEKNYDKNYIEYIYVNNAVINTLYEKVNVIK